MLLCNWEEIEAEALTAQLTRKYVSGQYMTLARFYLKKGCIVQAHSHANEQMSTVMSGAMRFVIDGREIVATDGQTVCIPPFSTHSVEALEDCSMLEVFSPVREDWIEGSDDYLRGGKVDTPAVPDCP